ncbi:hypothetical protein MPSEU_000436100 [Mayamaea pseudoterrestris]|nr:hypothetical protein MPSEU_000436100 [Mayamaea pseudoterrestris]
MSSNDKSNRKDAFGRDDMMAMLGGGLSETLTRRPTTATTSSRNASSKPDLSDLTTAETAAMLLAEQQSKKNDPMNKKLAIGRDRLRTHKVRAYHQLLHEEAVDASTATATLQKREPQLEHDDQDGNQDGFQIRKIVAPVTSTRAYDSSSTSSESEESNANQRRPQRRRVDSSSSDDDEDNAADARRKRLLEKRKVQSTEEVALLDVASEQIDSIPASLDLDKPDRSENTSSGDEREQNSSNITRRRASASSSSSSDSSSEESSTSDSSSDEDDNQPVAGISARPVFIPRHKRASVQQTEAEEKHEEELERLQLANKVKRKQESRAMVQQVLLASAQTVSDYSDALEGITGARNIAPDDADENDERARDEWQVRELLRLIEDLDVEQKRLAEERELARRRKLTDEERLQEDIAAGRFQRPGEQPRMTDTGPTSKRYHHQGAFYMDEDELAPDDVRRNAKQYARAATEADKIVKRGFANQSKYKGLRAEDTSDRSMEMLPLKRKK